MAQFFTLKASPLPTVEQVGGKALSLIYSANKGFPVPGAAVLPTSFFQPWMERLKDSSEWKAFAQTKSDDKAAAATALKNSAQTLTFSEDQKQTLSEVRRYLQSEGITLMAVRSSSPEEDQEASSFAGIYDTVLGVTDDGLQAAITTCFASALDKRVVSYKQKRGYAPNQPKIAVVIQKQINSEVSGVVYSLNPLNNSYDQCLINANFGLGETVVDGTVTPDQWVVDKVTNEILENTTGKKGIAVYTMANGGTESRTPKSPTAPCLSDDQVLAVTDLTVRVEVEYGKPMDIEWAYEGGGLYLLQARPITTYYKLPEEMVTLPGEQKQIYHDAGLSEQGLAENMSPLGMELFMYFTSFMMPGNPSLDFGTLELGMAFVSGGRFYTHLSRMLKILGKKNVIKSYQLVDSLGTQILDSMDLKEYLPKKLPKGFMKSLLKTGLGAAVYIKPLLKARAKPDQFLQHYLDENARLRAELKAEYDRTISFMEFGKISFRKTGLHMNGTQLPALYASESARGSLKKMFKDDPESVHEHLRSIERSFPHNVTIEMGLALYELSQFSDLRQTTTAEQFIGKLEANQLSPEFQKKWHSFMDDYGFRGPIELDIATPRFYEKPGELFALLKTMGTEQKPDLNPQSIFDRGAQQRLDSVQFLEQYLAKKSPGKVKAFKKNYKLLESFAAYRESPKYYIIMVIDYLRRRALEQGQKWVKAGLLDTVDQVFDLHLEEFTRAEVDPNLDIRLLANTNRDYYAQFNPNNDPPIIIDSRGFIPKLPPQPRKENQLAGTQVSSGTVIGQVKVLKHPDEKPILPGDILVTKATDPGWTTLFINAGGVLLESGGALQHGASIAREMGKPCIVGIEDVTKILQDGQTVEIDGGTGMIIILSENQSNPE
jgi:pyruvate,water dikinase